jgi:hypothetical protein
VLRPYVDDLSVKYKLLAIIAIVFIYFPNSQALASKTFISKQTPLTIPNPNKPTSRCSIDVTQALKNGKIQTSQYNFDFKSKASCERTSRVYSENFAPHLVKKKSVTMTWRGSR